MSFSVRGAVSAEDVGHLRGLHGRNELLCVEGARDAREALRAHVEVDDSGHDRPVPQERLDGADIGSAFEEMGGKRVPERMDRRLLRDDRPFLRGPHDAADRTLGD